MTGAEQPRVYCTACGAENDPGARYCSACGVALAGASASETVANLAFLLNELSSLRREGVIDQPTYAALHRRYADDLQRLRTPPALPPAPAPAPVSLPTEPAGEPEPPGRPLGALLAEQAPNLLLYMGAFLVVMAGLITVNTFALFPLTVGFLVAGWYFRRFPRVALAGNTYLAVGALLTPLNFVSAYLGPQGAERSQTFLDFIWLGGSAYSTLFYGALARFGLGRLYAWLTGAALLSTWTAALCFLDVPVPWAPPLYIILGLALAASPRLDEASRLRVTFEGTATFFAHVVTPVAVLFSVGIHTYDDHSLVDQWALPVSLALATGFYALPRWRTLLAQFVGAVLAGGTVLGIVYALGTEDAEVFGVVLAGLGLAYAAAWRVPFLRTWPGYSLLWPVGLGAATLSWLFFLESYADYPRFGAAALLVSTAVYLVAARERGWRDQVAELLEQREEGAEAEPARPEEGTSTLRTADFFGLFFLYSAGVTLVMGYYFLLRSVPTVIPDPSDDPDALALAYFPLSLAVGGVGVLARRWAPDWRTHLFVIALAISLFVVVAGVEEPARHAVYGATYAAAAIGIAVWERRPSIAYLAVPYGLVGLVGLLRALGLVDAMWPLLPAGVAVLVYGAGQTWVRLWGPTAWSTVIRYGALGLAASAPLIGIGRLLIVYGLDWLVLRYLGGGSGPLDPVQTPLHDAAAAAMGVLALLLAAEARHRRSINLVLAASGVFLLALLMVILRFQPDNIQYVSMPTGLYLWAVAVGLGRLARHRLSEGQRGLISALGGSAAVIVLTPTFLQGLTIGGWVYRFLLLGQGLVIFLVGIASHQRTLVAPAAAFVGLGALLQVLDVARALPNWIVLAGSGGLLLLGGTFLLLRQDLWLRWQRALADWWRA